ncbi:MAG: P-II family nitrogen regulator [Bacilli bacterium]|nr:P-II family nitrogen regulator [Bacilli bacterium]
MEKFKLIYAIVNSGYSEIVMDAARDEGAKGGTIIHARGTGTKEMEQKYGVIITPNKEMIMILVTEEICDKVLSAIYKVAGLGSKSQGIAFALPVDDVVGIHPSKKEAK